MFRAPTISGTRYTPIASITGTANRNIIVRPWVVKIWLYLSGPRNVFSGNASWMRISAARIPAAMKNPNAVTR